MWIVRLALRRPYTFVVVALLLLILGPLVILNTPTDIFPNINIPVVSIVWNYQGLDPEEMSDRIVFVTERALTTLVDDIEHIESQSLNGVAVVKVFFQPHAQIDKAIAQVTAISQTQLRQLPPGTTPPLVISYSASSVPVIQLALSSPELSEQQLFDYGTNFIRTRLVTIPGCAIPFPYGGKQRQIQVDLDTAALQAKGLSPMDVVNAISVQNLILPSGTSKIGQFEYNVDVNGTPQTVDELNQFPVKTVGNTTIYIGDVAHVRDGFPPQTNIVRVDGKRATLVTVLKAGNASTLDVISGVKSMLPQIESSLPPSLQVRPLADQSIFVRASIDGVVREATIAACLTGLMILIFLGSWRSTLIIAVSIPLSILTSIIVLSALGETINIMTLGGLALAVGILVDDATVEIENINRNIAMGKEIRAWHFGRRTTNCHSRICFHSGDLYRIRPHVLSRRGGAISVCAAGGSGGICHAGFLSAFADIGSHYGQVLIARPRADAAQQSNSRNPLVRMQLRFEEGFERFREGYHGWLRTCLRHRTGISFGFYWSLHALR